MDTETKNKFNNLEDMGYLPAVRERAMSLAVPFWWHGETPKEYRILGNGTLCLVRTYARIFGITAAHVYRKYMKYRACHTTIVAQFGGLIVAPEKRLIECNDTLDMATFLMSEKSARGTGHAIYNAPTWPPPRPTQGDIIVYGGYPGILKQIHADNMKVDYPFQTFINWQFGDLTSENMILNVNYGELHWPHHEEEKINTKPGGISGGPVYRLTEIPVPDVGLKWRLDLIGNIWEYYEPWEMMRARYADFIRADGTLALGYGDSTKGPQYPKKPLS